MSKITARGSEAAPAVALGNESFDDDAAASAWREVTGVYKAPHAYNAT